MSTQELYLFLSVLTPLMLIPIFGHKKNPVYFIIGMQLSFYIGHNFYEKYLYLNQYNLDNVMDIQKIFKDDIEAYRSIIFSNAINSAFATFLYVMTLGTLFWYLKKNLNRGTYQTLKAFLNSSLFYFLLFLGTLIDILLLLIPTAVRWNFSISSFVLIFPFLIKAISLKYPTPKELRGKTSKLTWGMLIFFIAFFTYFWIFFKPY